MNLLDAFFRFRHLPFRRTVLGAQFYLSIVAVHSHEWANSERLVLTLLVGKFRHKKQLRPVILLFATVYTKIMLQSLVLPLCLAIGLGMERGTQSPLYFCQVTYLRSEGTGENTASIGHNIIGGTVPKEDFFVYQLL